MKRVSFFMMWVPALWLTLSPCAEAAFLLLKTTHCAEKTSCCKKSPPEDSNANARSKHCQNHNHDGAGECSGLCKCNCCGHLATAFVPITTLIFESPIFSSQPEFQRDYHFDYHHAIWQPPKRV